MSASAFDRAIASTRREVGDGSSPSAVHDVEVDPGWTIGDKPNGGYLLAMLGRAAAATAAEVEGPDHPHPLGATAHYISAPSPGPAEVHVEVLRGRLAAQATQLAVRTP